jgi:hypothetical protein
MAAATGTVVIAQTGSNFDSATYPRFVLGDGTNTLTFVIDNDARGLKLTGGGDAAGYSSGADLPFEDSQRGRLVVPTYDEADGAKKALLAWVPTDYGNLTSTWNSVTANDGSSGLIAIGSRPHYVIRDVDGEEIKIGFGNSSAAALTANNAVLLAKYGASGSPRYFLYSETSGSRNYFIRTVNTGSNRWKLNVAFLAAIKHANDNSLIKVEAKGIGITGSLESLGSVANDTYTSNEIYGVLLQAEDAGYKGNASSMEFKDGGGDIGGSALKYVSWGYDEYTQGSAIDDITRHTLSPTNAQFWHGAEDTKIYFRQGTIAGSGSDASLSTAQIAEAIKDMINGSVLGITASRSSSTVNLTNDTDGNSGNVTITTTNEGSLFSISGMSNAGGGDEVAKTFINNKQMNITTALLPGSANAVDLGSAALEWNDIYLGDAAVIKFGSDQEVTMTHVPDVGLTITHTGSGDNLPVVLQLKSEEDAVIANEVLASIEFAAGDSDGTDGATVAAGIHAIAEETFAADANATKLVFTTADSETAAASATAKMTLASTGNLTTAGSVTAVGSFIIGSADMSEADLEKLDGITNGTAAASKAVVLDASKNIATIGTVGCGAITSTGASSMGSLNVGGTLACDTSFTLDSVVINATEIGYLDGVTAGTAAASKAMVLDASADITGARNVTISGELDAASLDVSGDIDVDGTANLDAVDIDGATQIDGTVTVGVNDTGYDVKFFGATSGQYMLWDESADELVLAGDSKLSFHDAAGGENLVASGDGHLEVNAGTTLDMTAPTVDINASTAVTVDSDTVTFGSANSADPLVTIKNTTNDANGARLRFVKDKGAAGADGDDVGLIEFYGDDDNQDQVLYARILAEVADASNGAEGGKLTLGVASHDGGLEAGLVITDGSADGELDITIGAGSSSVTTISGDLVVNGTTTTVNSTTVQIDDLNLQLADGAAAASAVNAGGITLANSGDDFTWQYNHASTAWKSSIDVDTASGKAYKIAGTSVLNATTLGSAVVASSLTSVGTLASGAISSGFGNIDNGASTLDTGAATVASLVCTAAGTFGGGYGATGATISTAGVIQADGNIETAGSFVIGSASMNEADLEKLDGITNGTAAASKAMVLDASADITGARNVTISGELDAASLDVSGDIDVDGTANLDAVDIDGAVQIDGTVTVGVDDTGLDVKFFGATAGAYLEWDESADELELRGGAATPGKLLLATAETTVVDGDKLGQIDFQAPLEASATDAILVAASIWAEADDTFAADNNDTDLVFATGKSAAASEKMRLNSDGDLNTAGSITAVGSFIIGSADLNEADMEKLDGITNGTVAASKAVVADANADVSGFRNVTATGSFIIGSASMNEADLEKLDGITNGTAAASKAVVLDASKNIATIGTLGCGAITSTGTSVFASLDISGDIDVDGTTNLDAVDIDGAVQLDNTFTVGADDQGYDVKFFGDTASAYMMWDTSADDLILGGAARAVVPEGQLVLGTTAVSSTATELNFLDGFADAGYAIGADSVVFFDATDSKLKHESAADFASAIAGNGLTASSGALTISWQSERFTKANVDATTSGNPGGGAALTIQLAQTPLGSSEMVFLNGMLLTAEESSGSAGDFDYAISGAVITFESEVVDLMDADDVISVQYVKQ